MPDDLVISLKEVLQKKKDKGSCIEVTDVKVLQEYNEILCRKLEKKVMDMEQELLNRKALDEALKKSEERFRKVFETDSLGIGILGPKLRFRFANFELCRMLGVTDEDLVFKYLPETLNKEDRAAFTGAIDSILKGFARTYSRQHAFIRPDGTQVWSSSHIGTITDSNGTLEFLLLFACDVSDQVVQRAMDEKVHRQVEGKLDLLSALRDQMKVAVATAIELADGLPQEDGTLALRKALASMSDIATRTDDAWSELDKVRELNRGRDPKDDGKR
ncbi:MAG: PAS domain S-box protein [Euryarchaeota archaeon]|nr:PAS domain S-box protein [Euryarchaeota archaeon]